MNANWIWLDAQKYAPYQKSLVYMAQADALSEEELRDYHYAVVDFQKTYTFREVPQRILLRVSGDTHFRLWTDDAFVGVGPACAGGDFLYPEKTLNWYYANPYTITPARKTVRFFAQVQLQPQVYTEYSHGRGGFYLEGKAVYADGTAEEFGTDATWEVRLNKSYCAPCTYDETIPSDFGGMASLTGDTRTLTDAPVKMLEFETILPKEEKMRCFAVQSGHEYFVDYPMIYGANVGLTASGACKVEITCRETHDVGCSTETITFAGAGTYRGFRMHSVGECVIRVLEAAEGVTLSPCLYFVHYPAPVCGTLQTSDSRLNRIFDLCRWTLKICRQTIHLDSTTHQEHLACTGDYYIETLMTLFTYGDLSLSRGDVLRTAQWLVQNNGRMFHTNYSLIWVQMLELVYRFTADRELLETCKPALTALLTRFNGYIGENGVIDNPPDYMFVDWMVADGYSLHHPPKYLGQTVLNAFYYGALCTAAHIAEICGWTEENAVWTARAEALKSVFDKTFYDEEKGLYFDGLPTPTEGNGHWHPANPAKKHFSRYPNILAARYGLCGRERAERLVRLAADDGTDMAPIQPYFMNFLLEAVDVLGLEKELGMPLLLKWMPSVEACEKGLQEGWYKPEEGYSFDHSHAWGGCPAYFIPQQILGLKMVEAGYKKITLSPDLCGLDWAKITFPVPQGFIEVALEKGKAPVIHVPEGISWSLTQRA